MSCYIAYDKLVEKRHIHWFQFLYYFSSFWGLFGSHTTSFLLSGKNLKHLPHPLNFLLTNSLQMLHALEVALSQSPIQMLDLNLWLRLRISMQLKASLLL